MITLIIPPSPFLINDKVFISLGILYVGAALEKKGHEVSILDLKGQKEWRTLVKDAAQKQSELIGITSTTADFPIALEILNIIKKENKTQRVVIGGAHATILPKQCDMFDSVIIGDGVTGIFDALKSREKYIHSAMIKNMDSLPYPARHLIDMNGYYYQLKNRSATNVMSQFGCPYQCIFCCGRNIKEYRTVRLRSPKSFIDELDFLNTTYGYNAFVIHDDEFNLKKQRTLEICRLLEKKDYLFRSFIRPDLFTEDIARAMHKAGFYQVDAGIESGSEKILKIIKKGSTPQINSRARALAKKYGIHFKAFITIGHPHETKEDVEKTKEWLLENKPDAFEIYVITPFPGSTLYDKKESFDLEYSIDYSRDTTSITRRYGEYRCLTQNSHMSYEEIAYLREKIDKEVRYSLGLASPEALNRQLSEHN